MATKGASNRYGGDKYAFLNNGDRKNVASYQWAKDFNNKSLERHSSDHGQDFQDIESYRLHAVAFANLVSSECETFVGNNNSTYKYRESTNEFAIITKDGYVVTYFNPSEGREYFLKEKNKYFNSKEGKK